MNLPAVKQDAYAWLGLLGRVITGGIFVYAGFVKASAPAAEFAYAIESYQVLPAACSLAAAYILPWIELILGIFLLAGFFTKISAFCTGFLLVGFEGLLLSVIIRKIPVTSCGCFGSSVASSPPREFLMNLALLAGAFFAMKYGERLLAFEREGRRPAGLPPAKEV